MAKGGETDKHLIVALATNGDQDAFSQLITREKSKVYFRLLRLCGDESLAEDLAQITFIEAWKSIRTLQSIAAFDAWLRRISINVWHQHNKKLSNAEIVDSEAVETKLDAEQEDRNIGKRLDLERALAKLNPNERLNLVLAFEDGMSHAEIAEMTDTPLGTVKSNIKRGMGKLKELMKDYRSR